MLEKIELPRQEIAGAVWSNITESWRIKKRTDYISISFKISFVFSLDIFMALVFQVKCNLLSP